jgi:hypothetical protein
MAKLRVNAQPPAKPADLVASKTIAQSWAEAATESRKEAEALRARRRRARRTVQAS